LFGKRVSDAGHIPLVNVGHFLRAAVAPAVNYTLVILGDGPTQVGFSRGVNERASSNLLRFLDLENVRALPDRQARRMRPRAAALPLRLPVPSSRTD